MRKNSSPQTPAGCPSTGAPRRYDRNRELRFVSPAPVGATPVADHPVEPLRGQVTNLNQDLTKIFILQINRIVPVSAGRDRG